MSGPKEPFNSLWGNESSTPAGGLTSTSMSYPVFVAMRRAAESQGAHLSAFKPIGRLTAVIGGNAELVNCDLVSGDFYQSMGVQPGCGPRDRAGRRPAQCRRHGRRDQRGLLGAALRARPLGPGPDDPDQPGARHHRRGESVRVHRLHRRPSARCLPAHHRATRPAARRSRPGRRDDRQPELLVGAHDGARAARASTRRSCNAP